MVGTSPQDLVPWLMAEAPLSGCDDAKRTHLRPAEAVTRMRSVHNSLQQHGGGVSIYTMYQDPSFSPKSIILGQSVLFVDKLNLEKIMMRVRRSFSNQGLQNLQMGHKVGHGICVSGHQKPLRESVFGPNNSESRKCWKKSTRQWVTSIGLSASTNFRGFVAGGPRFVAGPVATGSCSDISGHK